MQLGVWFSCKHKTIVIVLMEVPFKSICNISIYRQSIDASSYINIVGIMFGKLGKCQFMSTTVGISKDCLFFYSYSDNNFASKLAINCVMKSKVFQCVNCDECFCHKRRSIIQEKEGR